MDGWIRRATCLISGRVGLGSVGRRSAMMGSASSPPMAEGRTSADTRELDGDGGSLIGGAADGDGSAVLLDDLFDGGKPQADTGSFGGEERFEHLVHEVGRNRRAVVLDEDLHVHSLPRSVLGDLDVKVAARRHGLTGVSEDA